MNLIDLEPRWIGIPNRHGLGISFNCPHCQECRIAVWFKNPLDGGPPITKDQAKLQPGKRLYLWTRTGKFFKKLTLSPSIDASKKWGHWHGWVRNGKII